MHFTHFLPAAALLALAAARNQEVAVGKNGLTFEPNNIVASPGDTLTFKFYPRAHSVVQSDFQNPCQPIENGFNSNIIPVPEGVGDTVFVLQVNDTRPIWIYCSQAKHCQAGMVAVVNQTPGPNSLEAYAAAAKNVPAAGVPTVVQGGVLEAASAAPTPGATPGVSNAAAAETAAYGFAGVAALAAGLWGF
ncbi:Cupredoxin [Phyllosticta citrichinensis]